MRAAAKPLMRAFTIIELLVTVAIIILLLGLLLVGLQQAARAAQVAQTKTLMSSINRALVSFKNDVGYYPPVLGLGSGNGSQPIGQVGFGRDLLVPPLTLSGTTSNLAIQQWNSFTSLPEFLLGYGSRTADGYGFEASAAAGTNGGLERPPLGIRHPGRDGVWGAYVSPRTTGLSLGSFGARTVGISNPNADHPVFRGKALGPYLELKDAVFLGGITDYNTTTGEPTVVRATEGGRSATTAVRTRCLIVRRWPRGSPAATSLPFGPRALSREPMSMASLMAVATRARAERCNRPSSRCSPMVPTRPGIPVFAWTRRVTTRTTSWRPGHDRADRPGTEWMDGPWRGRRVLITGRERVRQGRCRAVACHEPTHQRRFGAKAHGACLQPS
jgi:type II secretory pathway pseudopilin PulG